MPPRGFSQRRRPPSALLERNSARILDAVITVVADAGWSQLTAAEVARAAGLSTRPIQDRFPDRWAMAGSAWSATAGPALAAALTELLASAGLLPTEDGLADSALGRTASMVVSTASADTRARLVQALQVAGLGDLVNTGGREVHGSPVEGPLGLLQAALTDAIQAADDLDRLALRSAGPSPAWLAAAYGRFLQPDANLRAAAEFLVVSQFNEGLAGLVTSQVGAMVGRWCDPNAAAGSDGLGAPMAARRAYLISTSLGLLLSRTRRGAASLDLTEEAALQLMALRTERQGVDLPDTRAVHLDEFLHFDTADPALDDLLRATLEEVGRVGYDAATTAAIGRSSGRSEGLLFARYPSKVEVFMDATRRQHAHGWRLNEEFIQSLTGAHGPGIAEAVMIREMQRPHLSRGRAISLEQVRLALHDERLRELQWGELDALVDETLAKDPNWYTANSEAHLHLSVAIGIGVTALPLLAPEAWSLPYDVVTIPLNEPGSR